MKVVLLLLAAIGLSACAKNTPQQPASNASLTPDQVVVKVFDALNRGDSVEFVSLLSSDWRSGDTTTDWKNYAHTAMAFYKKNHATVRIDSSHIDGAIAYVTYHIKITGENPIDTVQNTQIYKEATGWKYGY